MYTEELLNKYRVQGSRNGSNIIQNIIFRGEVGFKKNNSHSVTGIKEAINGVQKGEGRTVGVSATARGSWILCWLTVLASVRPLTRPPRHTWGHRGTEALVLLWNGLWGFVRVLNQSKRSRPLIINSCSFSFGKQYHRF